MEQDTKLVILIIDSDKLPAYEGMRSIWRQYMNRFAPQVKSYFIRCNPLRQEDYIDEENAIIYVAGFNERSRNIIYKTQIAMKRMLEQYGSLEYILRSNLSSFVHIPRLLKCVDEFPNTQLYSGTHYYNKWDSPETGAKHNFVSGDSILMSRDVCSIVIDTDVDSIKDHDADDVIIGHIMEIHGIPIKAWKKCYAVSQSPEKSDEHVYQFRCKTPPNRSADILLQKKLYDLYYGTSPHADPK